MSGDSGSTGVRVTLQSDGACLVLKPSKIVCLLRSYAAHAKELGNAVPSKPMFFLKPPSAMIESGGNIVIPPGVRDVHHEVELSIVIGRRGKNIRPEDALSHVKMWLVMLDMTARDVQDAAKAKGLPWAEAKGYDTFAPVGAIAQPASWDYHNKNIWLKVNSEMRQNSSTGLMLWSIEHIISQISTVMTLEEGDIIMTGTPEGVGPVRPGDTITAGIETLGES
ncbi:fumarylacetoacetate hydrolase family protein [Pelomyxa schiedti]|nr:fumarylacetoacetate hydrolase family protein [Pelomyxa schiedti]